MVSHVYEWVGSSDITPEYFQLCAFDSKCPFPSESVAVVDKQKRYMAESEDMPKLLEEYPEMNFMGFGSTAYRFSDTIPLDSTMSQPSSFLAVSPGSWPPTRTVDVRRRSNVSILTLHGYSLGVVTYSMSARLKNKLV